MQNEVKVYTPADCYLCIMYIGMDVQVIDYFILFKENQPDIIVRVIGRKNFSLIKKIS